MADSLDVALDVAAPGDAGLLANLLELYVHDLSEVFPRIEMGADGRFGYDPLPLYWSEPERRFPFLHPLWRARRRFRADHARFASVGRSRRLRRRRVFHPSPLSSLRRGPPCGVPRLGSPSGPLDRAGVRSQPRRDSFLGRRRRRVHETEHSPSAHAKAARRRGACFLSRAGISRQSDGAIRELGAQLDGCCSMSNSALPGRLVT